MGVKFEEFYRKCQQTIQTNRKKFEEFDNQHIGKHAAIIFDTYWDLKGSSNIFDGETKEKIKMTTKPAYGGLPDELKTLIS